MSTTTPQQAVNRGGAAPAERASYADPLGVRKRRLALCEDKRDAVSAGVRSGVMRADACSCRGGVPGAAAAAERGLQQAQSAFLLLSGMNHDGLGLNTVDVARSAHGTRS